MYWPIGTPRIYATSSSRSSGSNIFVSYDGLPAHPESGLASPQLLGAPQTQSLAGHDEADTQPPPTPLTPGTPAVQSVEYDDHNPDSSLVKHQSYEAKKVPLKDPVLALRVSRTGHMFAVITATSITLWQTKVRRETPAICDFC